MYLAGNNLVITNPRKEDLIENDYEDSMEDDEEDSQF